MATQKININKKLRDEFSFRAKLVVTIAREESGLYFIDCPVLDVCSQGKTIKEAKKNIAEAIELFIDYCCDHGILAEMLKDRGLRFAAGKAAKTRAPQKAARKRLAVPAGARVAHIPVSIPLVAA